LAIAWVMYANDNNDKIVNFLNTPNSLGNVPWRYIALPAGVGIIYPAGLTSAEDRWNFYQQLCYKLGALYQYAPNPTVINCPADRRRLRKLGAGYSYGSYSGVDPLNGGQYVAGISITKASALKHPTDRFLWVEENDPRGENADSWLLNIGTGSMPPNYPGATLSDAPAAWHGRSSSFSFADGHAENHSWRDPYTITWALETAYGTPPPPSAVQAPHDFWYLVTGYPSIPNP